MKPSLHAALLLSTTLVACHTIPHQQYRTHNITTPYEATTSIACLQQSQRERDTVETWSIEPHESGSKFALGVIEFRDDGRAWSDEQFQYVMKNIRDLATSKAADGTTPGALIVTFVHGWKNNAEVCNRNISCFREVLQVLANGEAGVSKDKGGPRHVIGLYLGWRGAKNDTEGLKELTFWDRKDTARIIGRGICTRWEGERCTRAAGARAALDELVHIYRAMRAVRENSRMVIVGHSFGAQVVFAALQDRLAESLRRDAIVEGLGNLVVLVNPAFEAAQYETLHYLSRTRDFTDPARQEPVLLTISTRNDRPTHRYFPVGQFFSLQWRARTWKWLRTIGNYKPFHTHHLTKTATPATASGRTVTGETCPTADGNPKRCDCETDLRAAFALRSSTGVELLAAPLTAAGVCTARQYADTTLTPLATCRVGNPLLNVYTTPDVINGHSRIFNTTFVFFLVDFIQNHDELLAGMAF